MLPYCSALRAFCYAGPSAWNAVPDFKKNSRLSLPTFRRQLKHFTSHSASTPSAFAVFFTVNALYKLLTYLLTYLWESVMFTTTCDVTLAVLLVDNKQDVSIIGAEFS